MDDNRWKKDQERFHNRCNQIPVTLTLGFYGWRVFSKMAEVGGVSIESAIDIVLEEFLMSLNYEPESLAGNDAVHFLIECPRYPTLKEAEVVAERYNALWPESIAANQQYMPDGIELGAEDQAVAHWTDSESGPQYSGYRVEIVKRVDASVEAGK